MSKGNPIVGLDYVVTSQHEMLEEANRKNAELVNEYEKRINELKSEDAELQKQCEEKDATITELREDISSLREDLQNEKDQCNYLSGEYDRIKKQLLDLKDQLQRERSNPFHWQKWEEGKEFPLDKFGNVPMVDGLYLFNDESKRTVWIEKEKRNAPLAGKFGIDFVTASISDGLKDRGVFTISPSQSSVSDGTLVAVSIRSIAEATLIDSMPELIDEE